MMIHLWALFVKSMGEFMVSCDKYRWKEPSKRGFHLWCLSDCENRLIFFDGWRHQGALNRSIHGGKSKGAEFLIPINI